MKLAARFRQTFKSLGPLFAFLLSFYSTQPYAYGQYFTGAVASGAGGAGRAANEPTETVLLNPASIAHAKSVRSGLFYQDGNHSEGDHETSIGLHIVDNHDDAIFPGALAYFQRHRTFSPQVTTVDEKMLSMSFGNFVYRQLAMGFSVQNLRSKLQRSREYTQWNGVFGLHFNPLPDLGLAFVYYNFANAGSEVPLYLRLVPKQSWALTYIITDFVRVRLDVSRSERHNPDKELAVQGGIESFLSDFIVLRIGYENDSEQRKSFVTAGLGFNGPKFQLDYSLRKRQGQDSGALHSVDMRVPFW